MSSAPEHCDNPLLRSRAVKLEQLEMFPLLRNTVPTRVISSLTGLSRQQVLRVMGSLGYRWGVGRRAGVSPRLIPVFRAYAALAARTRVGSRDLLVELCLLAAGALPDPERCLALVPDLRHSELVWVDELPAFLRRFPVNAVLIVPPEVLYADDLVYPQAV